MNDFTKKYAELISRYVDIDDIEHFHEDFDEGGLTANEDTYATIIQTNIGLVALLNLLEEKGVITDEEYSKKFDEVKEIVMNSVIEEIKKKFD